MRMRGRYIKDVCVDLEKHSIILIDDDGNGMYWESLRNASIQFRGVDNEQLSIIIPGQ